MSQAGASNIGESSRSVEIVFTMQRAMWAEELRSRRYSWIWTGAFLTAGAIGYRGFMASSASPLALLAFGGFFVVLMSSGIGLTERSRRRSGVESHQLAVRLSGLSVLLVILLAIPPDGATWWAVVLIALPLPLALADEIRWRRQFRPRTPGSIPASGLAAELLTEDAALKVLAAVSGVLSARQSTVSRVTGLTDQAIDGASTQLMDGGLLDARAGTQPLGSELRATTRGRAALGIGRD